MKVQNINPSNFKMNKTNKNNKLSHLKQVNFKGGLPNNFGEVLAGKLYRGAQPVGEAIAALKAKGITAILDLRDDFDNIESAAAASNGIKYTKASDSTIEMFSFIDEQLASGQVLYVHCTYGKERTGLVIAAHQLESGIPREQVIDDYIRYGGKNSDLI